MNHGICLPAWSFACLLSAACVHTGAAVLRALAHGPGPLEQTHGNRRGRHGQVRASVAGTIKCQVGSAGVRTGCRSFDRSFGVLFDGVHRHQGGCVTSICACQGQACVRQGAEEFGLADSDTISKAAREADHTVF